MLCLSTGLLNSYNTGNGCVSPRGLQKKKNQKTCWLSIGSSPLPWKPAHEPWGSHNLTFARNYPTTLFEIFTQTRSSPAVIHPPIPNFNYQLPKFVLKTSRLGPYPFCSSSTWLQAEGTVAGPDDEIRSDSPEWLS